MKGKVMQIHKRKNTIFAVSIVENKKDMKNIEKQTVIYQTELVSHTEATASSRMEATASPQLQDVLLRNVDGSTANHLRDVDGSTANHLRDADDSTANHLRNADGSTANHLRDANDSIKDSSKKFYSPYFDKHDYEHLHWATHLPHWHQDNKHIFVTFRLADSLPQVKLRDLQEKKDIWLKLHPKPWDVEVEKEYYDKFVSTIDRWLDTNYGECLLKHPKNRKITEDALLYFDGVRYNLKAFVIMPNHVHLLMQMKEWFNLESIMRSLKSFTAKQINKVMHRTGRLWQSEYFDRIIRSEDHYKYVLKYIVSNNKELAQVKDDSIPYCTEATAPSRMEATASPQLQNLHLQAADDSGIDPEQIFDYVYGVLHTPSYRAKYKEFLKVDFPRIPYPTGKEEFDRIAGIGTQLRKLHLMESVPSMPGIARFTTAGDNLVEKLTYKEGCVFFNDTQCFNNVPETAWNFYIGGYQPAQKWLKDRKGRCLTFDDILHYRNIIAVLLETRRLMGELG